MTGGKDNLKPVRSVDEARERGHNGGIQSGVVRRKKRSMKEAAKLLMDMPVSFGDINGDMKAMGIADEDLTNQMAILVSMFREAIYGNVRAAEFVRDTIGDDAEGDERKQRLKMDKERLKMEKERFEMEKDHSSENGDGMPTIINVRPEENDK